MPTYQCRQTQAILPQRINPPHTPCIPSRCNRNRCKHKAQHRSNQQCNLLPIDDIEALLGVGHEIRIALSPCTHSITQPQSDTNCPADLKRVNKRQQNLDPTASNKKEISEPDGSMQRE
jgi:hypothetical protein